MSMIGKTLGYYIVSTLIGRGGMGKVYQADDLKRGSPKLAEDPVRRKSFFAEVRITRQLSHPNICRVYDIREIESCYFLSMEFIDGESLASLLKRMERDQNAQPASVAQLAQALLGGNPEVKAISDDHRIKHKKEHLVLVAAGNRGCRCRMLRDLMKDTVISL